MPECSQIISNYETFVFHYPKEIVSGDFYWFSKHNKNNEDISFFCVSDCTGHGIPGAFMSMLGNSMLDGIINKEKTFETEKVLYKMNEYIIKLLKQELNKNHDGMDLALIKIVADKSVENKKTLYFSGAKRPLIIFSKKNNEIIYLKGNSKSIGGYYQAGNSFSAEKIELEKGDLIYMLSDGFTDQNNKAGKKLGIKTVKKFIAENTHKNLPEQKQLVHELFFLHKGNEPQRDDVTFMCIKV